MRQVIQALAQPGEAPLQHFTARGERDSQGPLAAGPVRRPVDDDHPCPVQQRPPDLVRGHPEPPDIDHDEQAALRTQRLDAWDPSQGLEHAIAAGPRLDCCQTRDMAWMISAGPVQ